MTTYRVKVIELHSDYVWVDADNEEEAMAIAHGLSDCEYECLHDIKIVSKEEDE